MLGTFLLHAVTSVAVRVRTPTASKRWIDHAASALRPLNAAQARRTMRWLMRLRIGTCLSRSLCIGARLPGAEVVIAVRAGKRPFAAHAWIELNGAPLMPGERVEDFHEITRLT